MTEPSKILIVDLNLLGDTIVFLPTLVNVRKTWPKADITYLTTSVGREVMESMGVADRIWVSSHPEIKNIFNFVKWWWVIRKEKFDLAITSCDTPSRPALLLFLAGIPVRVGFTNAKLYWFYNQPVVYDSGCHQAELNLRALRRLGKSEELVHPSFKITDSDKEYVDSLLRRNNINESDILIGIHPGSKKLYQRWDLNRFAELSDKLIERCRIKIICVGTPSERGLAKSLQDSITRKESFIDLTGLTTVKQLAYLLTRFKVFICNNSGPMHLAFLIGAPSVSLWGATSLTRWGPLWDKEKHIVVRADSDCVGCETKIACPKGTLECMKLITTERVLNAVERIYNTPLTPSS